MTQSMTPNRQARRPLGALAADTLRLVETGTPAGDRVAICSGWQGFALSDGTRLTNIGYT
ncbi:MAG: hypothetical protein Q7J57_14540 [Gemmobacter sp.]|nr:hypothetical protein [Gemmobacter sp.]